MSSPESYIGKQLIASDGDAGVIEDLLRDQDGTPRFLVVRDRGVFANDVVVPIEQVTIDGAVIRVAESRAQIHGGERYDTSRHGESAGLFSASASRYDSGDASTAAP